MKRLLESDDRVDESKLTFVVEENVVSVLSDVRYEDVVVSEGVASVGQEPAAFQVFGYLSVVGSRVGADGGLLEDESCFVQFGRDAEELKLTCHEARCAYRIRRQRPRISASFIGTCSRKHSNAAEIR